MKKFWSEFKAFIAKGNIVDLAVAIIIGTAFNKIVSSLVNDIIMPLVSLMVGGANVSDWKWVIREAQYDSLGNLVKAETALMYGSFIQAIIDFLIIALTVFVMIKIFNASRKRLDEFGHTVIAESKKTLKRLKKHNKKAAQVAVLSAESGVVSDTNSSTQALADSQPTDAESTQTKSSNDETSIPSTTQAKADNITPDTQAEANSVTPNASTEQTSSTDDVSDSGASTTPSKDDELLAVLKEIRDYMKKS